MRRVSKLAALVITGALALAGCGGSNSNDSSSGKGGEVKIGLAYDIGGRGDQSFNDAAAAGYDKALKDFDLEGDEQEPRDGESDSDKVQRLTEMARNNFNPIVAVGYAYASAVKQVAANFPKVNFAIIDDASFTAPNVANLVFSEEEGSYLAGAVAALKSQTGKVGFIGGVNSPLIQKFQAGFVQGVKATSKSTDVSVLYISQPPDTSGFANPAAGKKVAQGMLDNGDDVIFAAAGASGAGAIQAIAAKPGSWAIGVDSDQYKQQSMAPYRDAILTSMTKNVETAVYTFIKSVVDKEPQSGKVKHDLGDDGVALATSNPAFADDAAIAAKVKEIKQKIIAGKVQVKSTI